ncbi:MAG: N-acetylmuramoyl-L-alanine amidase [Bacillota bacterium]|nr:N-acetylmuramoyl-L-alanine amidase [Bacillota bacterium]
MKRLITLICFFLMLTFCIGSVYAQSNNVTYQKSYVGIVVRGEKIGTWDVQPINVGGRILVASTSVFDKLGIRYSITSGKDRVSFTSSNTTVTMITGSSTAQVNGSAKDMGVSPVLIGDTVMVPLRFAAEAFGYGILWDEDSRTVLIDTDRSYLQTSRGSESAFRVVIDPGHGGSETGAQAGGIQEKDLNLDVSLRLYKMLKDIGMDVYITRTSDIDVGLYERSGMANNLKADLFVSIHNNAASSGAVGTMVLYYPDSSNTVNGMTGSDVASLMEKNLTAVLGTKNLGIVPRPNLAVLRTTDMPAVLAELGFMTNPNELKLITSENFKQKAAESLRDTIIAVMRNK